MSFEADLAETLEYLRVRYPGSETFVFGNGPELNRLFLDLVRSGKKTATCVALRDIENGTETLPQVGARDIALH